MDLRDTLRTALESDPRVVAAWLYGSRARGTERHPARRHEAHHEYADVDLAVVRQVVERHTGDLVRFVAAVRARIPS